jgi:hypothetical protein
MFRVSDFKLLIYIQFSYNVSRSRKMRLHHFAPNLRTNIIFSKLSEMLPLCLHGDRASCKNNVSVDNFLLEGGGSDGPH